MRNLHSQIYQVAENKENKLKKKKIKISPAKYVKICSKLSTGGVQ